jgi:uncharacterized membrane protein
VQTFGRKILTILLWTITILIGSKFYFENIPDYVTGNLSPRKAAEKWWLVAHFVGAGCTLFLGPLQFIPAFRNRFRKWHRIAGKFYVGGSILSALMVFYLLSNYPLPGSILSLGLLAIIWLFTTCAAFWFALKKDFKQHRHFMIRSYICGLAFVFIRILPIINTYTGIFNFMENEDMIFTIYEWICWIYPLIITEFFLVWWPAIVARRKAEVRAQG